MGGYAISCQNNLKFPLGCYTCMLIELFCICMPVVRTDGGRSVYGHVIYTFFLGSVDLLTHDALLVLALRARELRYYS